MATAACDSASDMLNLLPPALLDELVSDVFKVAPSLRATFLASLGSRIHASAVRVLFDTLIFPDDARLFESSGNSGYVVRSTVTPLLANPKRYGHAVEELVVCDTDMVGGAYTNRLGVSLPGGPVVDSLDACRPLDAKDVSKVLEICGNLERLTWESSFPPPDGLCEVLVSHNPRLTHFSFFPNARLGYSPSSRLNLAKWDSPSLPLLSSLPLTSLRLSRLSQAGARSLSVLLSNMGEYSTLEELSVDFVWLDDHLCEKIVEAGGKLRKLRISTSGTKLTDKGMVALIEGLDALRELALDEVQGRLSRGLWTKPTAFPPNLAHFQIVVNENGPHHSWTKDHLQSLHAIPFDTLVGLSVVRREILPRIDNSVPVYDAVLDDVLALKPVSKDFLDHLRGARSLTRLECDWWAWSIADLKAVLESCPNLETLKICLDAPFAKLMGLTASFAPLTSLRTLSVCVSPLHAPGRPPVPLLPFTRSSLPTPRESPVMKAKSVLPQLLDFDQMQTQTCLPNDIAGDPSMPLLRDVKKFVRRCLKLSLLEWYGKTGRGSWIIARPSPTTSKISVNVSVEYIAPMISDDVWLAISREKSLEQSASSGWRPCEIVRGGQMWTGDGAKAFEAERLAGKDRDDRDFFQTPEKARVRETGRKTRLSSVSTSSSTSGASDSPSHANQLPTPTRSTPSLSPEQTLSPLTPTYPESPIAPCLGLLSSVSEDGLGSPVTPAMESAVRTGRAMKGRTRSMNALGSQIVRERESSGSGGKKSSVGMNGTSGSGSGSHRSGKGRGRGGSTSGRRAASGDGEASPTVNGTSSYRGRGGRGSMAAGDERRKNWRVSTR